MSDSQLCICQQAGGFAGLLSDRRGRNMRRVQPAEEVGRYGACPAGYRRSSPRQTRQRPTLDGAKQQQVLAAGQLLPQHVKLQRQKEGVATVTTHLNPCCAGSLRQLCHPHGTIACAACRPTLALQLLQASHKKASPAGKRPSADARGPCHRRWQCWCRTPMHRLQGGRRRSLGAWSSIPCTPEQTSAGLYVQQTARPWRPGKLTQA